MDIDSIAEIAIDDDGRLCVRPATVVLPYIWREAMQVHWDDRKGLLYSPKPREWSYAVREEIRAVATPEREYR